MTLLRDAFPSLGDVWPAHRDYVQEVVEACEQLGHVPGDWWIEDEGDPDAGAWLVWRGLELDRSEVALAARDGDPEARAVADAERLAAPSGTDWPLAALRDDRTIRHRVWREDYSALLLPPTGPTPAPGLDTDVWPYGVALHWQPTGWSYARLDAYEQVDPDDAEQLPLRPMESPAAVAAAAVLVLAGRAEQVETGSEQWAAAAKA